MTKIDIHEYVDQIKSHKDFMKFIELLIEDYKSTGTEWENNNLEAYLEGTLSFMHNIEGYIYFNKDNIDLKQPTWRIMALILLCARVYE